MSDEQDIDGAMIPIKDGTYISSIWYCGNADGDWLCALFKKPGDKWRLRYRFRYTRDSLAHNSKDEKSRYAYEIDANAPEMEVVESVCGLIPFIAQRYGRPVEELRIRSDKAEDALRALQSRPWAHMDNNANCPS